MAIKIPQKSITYIITGTAVIVILLIAGVYPLHRALVNRDDQIADRNFKLTEQQLLQPVHQALKQKLDKKKARLLPLPAQAPLPRDQFGRVDSDLKELSGKAKVELISFTPALGSTDDKSKTVSAEAVAQGEFFAMRKFLVGLSSIPYVESIEVVQISRTPAVMELKVKFLVARS
jgi:hypothetical protein